MTCLICGAQLRSHPEVSTNWRAVEAGAIICYVCPDEFPGDGSASEKYEQAYKLVMRCVLSHVQALNKEKPIKEVELYRMFRRGEREAKSKGFGRN